MLMPDPLKAIETSKSMLKEDGRIGFLLTLNKHENKLLQKLKPLIKRITTIDFGNVVYEHQFEDLLSRGNLQVEKKVRVQSSFNFLLKLFPVYFVETKMK